MSGAPKRTRVVAEDDSSSSPPVLVEHEGAATARLLLEMEAKFKMMEGWAATANERAAKAEADAAAMRAELAEARRVLQEAVQAQGGAKAATLAAQQAQQAAQAAMQLAAQQAEERNREAGARMHAARDHQGLNMAEFAQMQAQAALTTKPRTFAGKGAAAGLTATDWIADAEYVFRTNEQLLGTAGTASAAASRLALAAAALTDEARVWYRGLTEQGKEPSSWEEFKRTFKGRFDVVSSSWFLQKELEKLVERHQQKRENMSMDAMSAYCSRFEELANRLPDEFMLRHTKLNLLAQGLPLRARRTVMDSTVQEDYTQAKTVSEMVALVLRKAATDLYAREGVKGLSASSSSPATSSSSSSGVADMDLGALTRAMDVFGVNRSQAAQYLREQEGWAPHDTSDSGSSSTAPAPHVALTAMLQGMETEKAAALLLNAFGTHRNRTAVSQGIKKTVPKELADARKKAGLCLKCGVVQYVTGGHTARSCRAPVDLQTGVKEGRKKAGMPEKDF